MLSYNKGYQRGAVLYNYGIQETIKLFPWTLVLRWTTTWTWMTLCHIPMVMLGLSVSVLASKDPPRTRTPTTSWVPTKKLLVRTGYAGSYLSMNHHLQSFRLQALVLFNPVRDLIESTQRIPLKLRLKDNTRQISVAEGFSVHICC